MSVVGEVHRVAVLVTFTVGFWVLAAVLAFFGLGQLAECSFGECQPRSPGELWVGWGLGGAAAVALAAPVFVAGRLWRQGWLYALALAVVVLSLLVTVTYAA